MLRQSVGRATPPPTASPALTTILLAAGALALAGCVSPAPSRVTERLRPCPASRGLDDAYCGTLSVFEDRAAGRGRRIDLQIVVLAASTDEPRRDPLYFLAGGPGQGAAKMADVVGAVFGKVRRQRDIVLVDQRGTGRSHPLDCPTDRDSLQELFGTREASLERVRACLKHLDADVRLYTTAIAMDDLDDVRAYLGYDAINLYGGSYGTRAALVYLRQHGGHVRAMALDGVVPTSMRLPLFAARDAQLALDRTLADCDRSEACRTAFPGLHGRVGALLARLERSPVRTRLVHPRTGRAEHVEVTARTVASLVFGALYSPTTAAMLPILLDRAAHDDFQSLVALAMASDSGENMSIGMQLSVLCSEDAPRISAPDVEKESAGSVFGGNLAVDQIAACESWPRGPVDPGFYQPVTSNVPVLILSGEIDPVTPSSWGEEVAKHLPHSRHVVAPATGHGVVGTPCGARLVIDFLDRGNAESLDTSCVRALRRPPFFVSLAGPDPLAGAK